MNAADACTNDFVEQLEAMGFQAEVGIPGY